jgi:hypothetical protein
MITWITLSATSAPHQYHAHVQVAAVVDIHMPPRKDKVY